MFKNFWCLLLFLILHFFLVHAQNGAQSFFAPVTPPSPTVGDLGKFGNLSVGLSTGAAATSIPLYELKVRDNYSVNLQLNYSTNGVIVDHMPGNVGTDWSLTGECAIRRAVFDDPDELSHDYTHMLDGGVKLDSLNKLIYNGRALGVDVQADLFTLISPNFAGRFYLQGDSGVFINKNTSFKVKRIPLYGFKVTDGKGNVLYYGGSYIEKTTTRTTCIDQAEYPEPSTNITGWFLDKVITPYKDSILFKYDDLNYSYTSGTRIQTINNTLNVATGTNCNCPQVSNNTCKTNSSVFTFFLREIKTNANVSLKFRDAFRADNFADRILAGVDVYSYSAGKDSLIKSINLSYSYGNKKRRPFLTRVGIYSGTRNDSMVYRMDYNNISQFPDMQDMQTDGWGYYNAKNPASVDVNPVVSYYGTLSKIYYPTGGYDTIAYETNTRYATETYTKQLPIGLFTGYGTGDHTSITYSNTVTINKNDGNIEVSGYTQYKSAGGPTPSLNKMWVQVLDHASGSVLKNIIVEPSTTSPFRTDLNRTIISTNSWFTSGDTKTIDVQMLAFGEDEYGEAVFYQNKLIDTSYNIPIGGVRVKTVTSVRSNNSPIVKSYGYNSLVTNHSTGRLVIDPDFVDEITTRRFCSTPVSAICYVKQTFNKSLANLFSYSQAPVYYESVIERIGEKGENGYIQHEFDLSLPTPGMNIVISEVFSTPTNSIMEAPFTLIRDQIAVEKKTSYFKRVGGAYEMVKAVENTYTILNSTKRYGYTFRQRVFPFIEIYDYIYGNYDVYQYYLQSSWFGLTKTLETNYSDNGALQNSTSYYYDQLPLNNNINRIYAINSKGDTLKKIIKYPTSYLGQAVYDSMVARNMIDIPISQEQYSNGQFISQSLANFKFNTTNKDMVVVSGVQAKQDTGPLEERVHFERYDAWGNVLERSKTGDITTVYLWGYNHQYPVCAVIGTDYNAVAATVSQSKLDNPSGNAELLKELDKVRIALTSPVVQVSTFSYIPAVGVTSETNPNGIITKYEYDNLSKLAVVRDPSDYILKQYVYRYASPDLIFTGGRYTNAEKSRAFTKDDCIGGVSSPVTYVIPAGKYFSDVSQAQADSLAEDELTKNGLQYARDIGTCEYGNSVQSQDIAKTDCSEGGAPSTVTYTVAENKYHSFISLSDANNKAIAEIDSAGTAYANKNGTCTFSNKLVDQSFTKACPSDGTGSAVNYAVAAGKYTSQISQADADAKAAADIAANGQKNADDKGHCVFTNTTQSKTFKKQDCVGAVGSEVTLTLAPGSFYSWISTQDANDTALAYIDRNGQANANQKGYCTWSNVYVSRCGSKSCTNGYTGSSVCYPVAAGTYTSTISQSDADAKATADLDANTAAYIESHSQCVCTGENKKVINGKCVAGVKVYSGGSKVGNTYICVYHYEWTDGTISPNYNESSSSPCPTTPL